MATSTYSLTVRLFVLSCVMFTWLPLATTASAAQESIDLEGGCVISQDTPLVLEAELGVEIIATCNDGMISTYSQSSGLDPSFLQTTDGVLASSGCYGRSTLYEQFGVVTTWYDVGAFYNYNSSSIYGLYGPYQDWYARSLTGWSRDYGDAFFYQGGGTVQQVEGWAGFSTSLGGYNHEHHMIVSFSTSGSCVATDYFWGTIGNGWWWSVYSHY